MLTSCARWRVELWIWTWLLRRKVFIKARRSGLGCISGVRHLSRIYEVLGSIPKIPSGGDQKRASEKALKDSTVNGWTADEAVMHIATREATRKAGKQDIKEGK